MPKFRMPSLNLNSKPAQHQRGTRSELTQSLAPDHKNPFRSILKHQELSPGSIAPEDPERRVLRADFAQGCALAVQVDGAVGPNAWAS